MQRLVYTPRAYVFVKNSAGEIHDLSRYVTAGSVQRRIDQVSSASITLRNPKMIFTTRYTDMGVAHATFRPMDPITIYLQRIKGRPVRVFTGFLDSTPYLQLYPGTITLKASCTLKRLLYTYFDPALPYTQSFLIKYGWLRSGDGEWYSNSGLNEFKDTENLNSEFNDRQAADASISKLLHATLQEIGNWDDKHIYIEPIPLNLFDRLSALAAEFEEDNKEAAKEFEELMRKVIGEGDYGGAGGDNVDVSGINGDVPERVFRVGRAMAIPTESKLMLAAMMTGLVEAPIDGGRSFGNPKGGDLSGVPGAPASRKSSGWRQETEGAYPGVDRMDVNAAARRFFTEGKAIMSGRAMGKAGTGHYQSSWSAGNLAQAIQGSQFGEKYDQVRENALALLRKVSKSSNSTDKDATRTPGQAMDPDNSQPDTQETRDARRGGDKDVKTTRYDAIIAEANRLSKLATSGQMPYGAQRPPKSQNDCSSSVTLLLKAAGYKIPGWPTTASIKPYLKRGKDPTGKFTLWDSDKGNISGLSVHIWAEVNGRPFTTANGMGGHWKDDYYAKDNPESHGFEPFHVAGLDQPASVPANADTSEGGSGADPAGAETNVAGAGAAGAFFATLDLPSLLDQAAASMLHGEKSLLNDQPLMPFIQQLCNASLRHFQSMPDGKFYAFYPDYFGEFKHHDPYWLIDDIEILDGGVDLSDDAVTTHMYVVGDTLRPLGGGAPMGLRASFSNGVVTIFNAFMADSILHKDPDSVDRANGTTDETRGVNKEDKTGMDITLSRNEALKFLQRYGARPALEDMPMIKSPWFEMFLAYQKFMQAWARQFVTPFVFTFMPEIYPGGKVGFPDHGLQMYVEEVEHTFDYESGFMTQASLSSPSQYGENPLLPPNMVKAIVDPITDLKPNEEKFLPGRTRQLDEPSERLITKRAG